MQDKSGNHLNHHKETMTTSWATLYRTEGDKTAGIANSLFIQWPYEAIYHSYTPKLPTVRCASTALCEKYPFWVQSCAINS